MINETRDGHVIGRMYYTYCRWTRTCPSLRRPPRFCSFQVAEVHERALAYCTATFRVSKWNTCLITLGPPITITRKEKYYLAVPSDTVSIVIQSRVSRQYSLYPVTQESPPVLVFTYCLCELFGTT